MPPNVFFWYMINIDILNPNPGVQNTWNVYGLLIVVFDVFIVSALGFILF